MDKNIKSKRSFSLKRFFQVLRNKFVRNRPASEVIVHCIMFVFFALLAFSYVYMIGWCFVAGLRTHQEVVLHPFDGIQWHNLHWSNYAEVLTRLKINNTGFFGMIANSLFFSFLGPFLNIMTTIMFAYATTKYRFPGSKAVYYIIFITMILPIYGTGGSIYKLFYNLKLINSRLFIVTTLSATGMNYMYFNAFFRGLSNTYSEAAQIDGANPWQIFFRVVFPQTFALFGALFIMSWIADWNGYQGYLIYLPRIPVLSVGIYQFNINMKYEVSMHILFAACFYSMLPPLILFISCNKIILNNVSLGGIKE